MKEQHAEAPRACQHTADRSRDAELDEQRDEDEGLVRSRLPRLARGLGGGFEQLGDGRGVGNSALRHLAVAAAAATGSGDGGFSAAPASKPEPLVAAKTTAGEPSPAPMRATTSRARGHELLRVELGVIQIAHRGEIRRQRGGRSPPACGRWPAQPPARRSPPAVFADACAAERFDSSSFEVCAGTSQMCEE